MTLRETFSDREISRIVFLPTKYSRLIRLIVSTVSIPATAPPAQPGGEWVMLQGGSRFGAVHPIAGYYSTLFSNRP